MIFDLPIEPLPERYSVQWARWFPEAYNQSHVPYQQVTGEPLTNKIEVGSFLDVYGTNFYKARQLSNLVALLRETPTTDHDWVLFHDLWYPGIESLAYIRQGANKRFRIAGCLHAGTWDPHDFLTTRGMRPWAFHFERAMMEVVDLVFVATEFHKELLLSYLGGRYGAKVKVTGFPIYPQEHDTRLKRMSNLVVFPHRLDPEKAPNHFDCLAAASKNLGLVFMKTKEVCKTKTEYYQLLQQASFAVSFAMQETWGIAMQEAVFAGCIPLVPNRLSYREMFPADYRFADSPGMANVLHNRASLEKGLPKLKEELAHKGATAIVRMLREMEHAY